MYIKYVDIQCIIFKKGKICCLLVLKEYKQPPVTEPLWDNFTQCCELFFWQRLKVDFFLFIMKCPCFHRLATCNCKEQYFMVLHKVPLQCKCCVPGCCIVKTLSSITHGFNVPLYKIKPTATSVMVYLCSFSRVGASCCPVHGHLPLAWVLIRGVQWDYSLIMLTGHWGTNGWYKWEGITLTNR